MRGTYQTEAECDALLIREGGVLPIMADGARAAGLVGIRNPVRGDIGVLPVFSSAGPVEIGAICTGTRWVAKSARGLRFMRAKPLAAWSLPDAC